jgi:Tfp pilus assembly protein PilO
MLVPLIKKLHNYLLAWAWPTRIILLLLIILVGVALGYLTDIRLLQNKLAKQTKNLSQLEMQTRKEQELIINVKAEEKQLINWAKNYLLSVTPSAMLNFLILMVKQEAVTLLWLKPGSSQCDDKFCVYPFELSLSGKYQNLIRCISAMLAAPYLTAISNLKIEKLNYNITNNLSNEHTPLILVSAKL